MITVKIICIQAYISWCRPASLLNLAPKRTHGLSNVGSRRFCNRWIFYWSREMHKMAELIHRHSCASFWLRCPVSRKEIRFQNRSWKLQLAIVSSSLLDAALEETEMERTSACKIIGQNPLWRATLLLAVADQGCVDSVQQWHVYTSELEPSRGCSGLPST